jgi:ferredoxin-like protein FixX
MSELAPITVKSPMSELAPITVNVDSYLSLNKYTVDEGNPHIELVDEPNTEEFLKLVRVCPAGLYRIDDEGKKSFDYVGCLECGACRITCGATIIKTWRYPQPTMGVEYRYG